jgi:hypothetical protein
VDPRTSYEESLEKALRKIQDHVPEDLVPLFAEKSGIRREDIHPIARASSGTVSAVDGSNAMVLSGGSVAIAAIRAACTTFTGNERTGRAATPLRLVTIGPGHKNHDFDDLFEECFPGQMHKGLDNAEPEKASGALRDTLEYWVALETVKVLPAGALLLLDGALRITNHNHEPVLTEIITTAQARGVNLAAVTKQTRATWGGGHPLLPALAGLVTGFGIAGPWWTKIEPHLIDPTEYHQGRHGEMYVSSLHRTVSRPLKIELPKGIGDRAVGSVMQALAACADDGRIPGYPYPLLDAHRTVAITDEVVDKVQQDIRAGLTSQGIHHRRFEDLFGDLHDEFERY